MLMYMYTDGAIVTTLHFTLNNATSKVVLDNKLSEITAGHRGSIFKCWGGGGGGMSCCISNSTKEIKLS